MAQSWWRLLHLVGVFAFLIVHGVSVGVAIRLRNERDPARINSLLDMSGRTVMPLYLSMLVLIAGGVAASFNGHYWGTRWLWAAIILLVVITFAMYAMARPYYQKVRFISRAIAEGSKAVTPEQFDSVLTGRRPMTVAGIGFVGLALILLLMVVKPSLGQTIASDVVPTTGTVLKISASGSRFDVATLAAPADAAFKIAFRNDDSGLPHNVAIYTDSSAKSALFKGELFPGPATKVYSVGALDAGTYFYRCDLHPTMTGSLKVG
jgi:plastocyanin